VKLLTVADTVIRLNRETIDTVVINTIMVNQGALALLKPPMAKDGQVFPETITTVGASHHKNNHNTGHLQKRRL
jgi:hypothetical protein